MFHSTHIICILLLHQSVMFLLFCVFLFFSKWQTNSIENLSFVMKSLNISLWNIQGLKSSVFGLKSKNPDFMREIHDLDVIILQETWCRGDESTGCPSGYRETILSSVKLKSTTQGRDSGGMIIWTKSDLSIELVKREQYHLWLKIKKGIISTSQPVFLCAIYIPPLESPYFQEETFQNIEQEISHFQAQGNVLLMGDFNSRTGDKLDFIESQGSRFITGNNRFSSFPPPQTELWSGSERSRKAAAAALSESGSVHRQWKTARRLTRSLHLQLSSW